MWAARIPRDPQSLLLLLRARLRPERVSKRRASLIVFARGFLNWFLRGLLGLRLFHCSCLSESVLSGTGRAHILIRPVRPLALTIPDNGSKSIGENRYLSSQLFILHRHLTLQISWPSGIP